MYDLIKQEVEKIRSKYLKSAEEIVSAYNHECSLSKDYEGRQIFELLQNADDEAENSEGKVLITFDGKTLSVSNTGKPFSFRGIKSLLYPNASPKKIHANKIGCKGLGFRSILTWTDSITIASKEFTIQFAKENAKNFLKEILEEQPALKDEISALTKEKWPIATLTCPKPIYETLLVEGFSTSIIIECRDGLAEIIQKQIESLEFEELVFLPHLTEIEINSNTYHKVFYKVSEQDEALIENENKKTGERECVRWRLFKKTGTITDETGSNKDYEFIIAFDPDNGHRGEVLYSYFKTDVRLQFPALIHGTFELTSDRNSLQKQSMINKQLVPLLADFMVQTAVKISEEQNECDYTPLSLVITPDTNMDKTLGQEYHFNEFLKTKARKESILPTIANKYISLDDHPYYSSNPFSKILCYSIFPTLLQSTDCEAIEKYIQFELGINFYDYDEFCKHLNQKINIYSMEKKAELIYLIEQEYPRNSGKDYFPHLMVDSKGHNICDESRVYPLPTDERRISLPEWVDVKFLNNKMEQLLSEKFQANNNRRMLTTKLSRYHVEEYRFESLVRSVVNQVDERLISTERCSDILNWLFSYYSLENRQDIPEIKAKVICRDGSIRYAKECYFGVEYDNTLGENLVGIYSKNFVGLESLNIKCKDKNTIIDFLEWIGVSKYPRLIYKQLGEKEREEFLKTCYPLYVQLDDCSYDEDEFGCKSIDRINVGIFEHFTDILRESSFNDLLAWFILDNEMKKRISKETEEYNKFSCIMGRPGRKINQRSVMPQGIKSYLRYILSTTKWIMDKNGKKEDPAHCCFEDIDLAPYIIRPAIDYSYIKKVVGRTCKKDIDAVLSELGVTDVFQEMNKEVIYEVLLSLPQLDPKCQKTHILYRKLLRDGLSAEEYGNNNPIYDKFIKSGKVAVKQNGMKFYAPISDAKYIDKKAFSNEIIKKFKIFDVDPRSGEEKVRKLFGVHPLKYTAVEITGTPKIHPLNEEFKKNYVHFLPFVFACRMDLKQSQRDFRNLKFSKVTLCSSITIKYKFSDVDQMSALDPNVFEHVYLRESNTAYICVPDKFIDFSQLRQCFDFADTVAEIITTILDVNEEKEFYRDLFRDSDLIREKKMKNDKGDENLELLTKARTMFNSDLELRDAFWMTMAELSKRLETGIDNLKASADDLIECLGLPADVDAGIKYNELSSEESLDLLIPIFKKLDIDIDQYNKLTVYTIDAVEYWKNRLKSKMKRYKPKYLAYLIDEFKSETECVQLYEQYTDEYIFLNPSIQNSVFVDIDQVFLDEIGIDFETLDKYGEDTETEKLKAEKLKISKKKYNELSRLYPQSKIDAYLAFGRIEELCAIKDKQDKEIVSETSTDKHLKDIAKEILALPSDKTVGFENIEMHTPKRHVSSGRGNGQHAKKTHNERSEKKKQEIGMAGEVCVYRELKKIYSDVKWISGNAEKAGFIEHGDDTCGYDFRYVDQNGNVQYVEVKASRSDEISFIISENELRFACQNAKNHEIIYVVLGEDGLSANKLWRLGHLFQFKDGENLMENDRFSIESERYTITAKVDLP